MRVSIRRDALLRQLPRDVQLWLIGSNDLPDTFEFDSAIEVQNAAAPDLAPVTVPQELKYIRLHLTPLEWALFADLVANPAGVHFSAFRRHFQRQFSNASLPNLISVHIMHLRRKLKEIAYQGRIEIARGSGKYVLITMPNEAHKGKNRTAD